jgi:hypothetical protein
MTPYELRFEIFKTALSIAESEFFFQKEAREKLLESGVDKKTVDIYIKDYPYFPTVKKVAEIAKQINTFVSEQS